MTQRISFMLFLFGLFVFLMPMNSLAVNLSDDGCENFDNGSAELTDWKYYTNGESSTPPDINWTYNTSGWLEGLAWGWNCKSCRIYEPVDSYFSPTIGSYQMKVTWRNNLQETGILARASGIKGSPDSFIGIAFGIKASDGLILLRDSAMDIDTGAVGTMTGFSLYTPYILRLNWQGNNYWGEVYDAMGSTLLFTSPIKTTTLTGGSYGLYMGNSGSSSNPIKNWWDDAKVLGYDWKFYTIGPSDPALWIVNLWSVNSSGWMTGLNWGWAYKSALLYEPANGYTVTAKGSYEMKVSWSNAAQESGILARAIGISGNPDTVNGLAFGLNPIDGSVLLRDMAMDIGSGSTGILPTFTINTPYILRLNWSDSTYWGEIYDSSGTSRLFTTPMKTTALTGNTVGIYMGNNGSSGGWTFNRWENPKSIRNDWSFYTVGPSDPTLWNVSVEGINSTGWIEGQNWGWHFRSGLVYEPMDGYTVPPNGYYETRLTWKNNMQEAGILTRARGARGNPDTFSGLAFGIDPTSGTVLLRDAAMSISTGSVGTFSGFAIDTPYVLRLHWQGDSYWGEIYDNTGATRLFTTPTQTTAITGGSVGIYQGNNGSSGSWNTLNRWENPKVVQCFVSGENCALHKAYTLDPLPDYQFCTDVDDTMQLTDGDALPFANSPSQPQNSFWTQTTTVGWIRYKTILVTIDLGTIQPINGVSFNTAANMTSDPSTCISWPEYVQIFVSNENQQFYEVGNLIDFSNSENGSPPASGYAVHKYRTHGLQTYGRYITLAFKAWPNYAWSDEIEVYYGDPTWVNLPRTGNPISNVREFMLSKEMAGYVKRLMQNDIDAIRDKTNASAIPSADKSYINSELDSVQGNLFNLSIPYANDFKAILPLHSDHARILKAQAHYWSALGRSLLTVWSSNLWDSLSHIGDPPAMNNPVANVDMMSNEYRAGAFNLSNAGEQTMTLNLRITGLPGGTNPSWVTVHEVPWTDTEAGQPVAAALPVVNLEAGYYPITVLPGLTRQVWFTFHPTAINSGSYSGQVEITGTDVSINVPVNFTVRPLSFPLRPTLHFGGYDYSSHSPWFYSITENNKAAFLAHLRDHFVDTAWALSAVMPLGQYDAQGNLSVTPNTLAFDAWLVDWPITTTSRYKIFLEAGDHIGQFAMGTAEFNTAVRAWTNFWADYVQSKGLQPDQISLLLVDEPGYSHGETVIEAWADAIHSAGRGFEIWEDPIYATLSDIVQPAMNKCDVLCPNRLIFLVADQAYRDYFTGRQTLGVGLEFTSCQLYSRLLDPYSYYRLQAWTCWQYNAPSMHVWAFGHTAGKSSWNEYMGDSFECTPFFIEPSSITTGKQMEACREGIEDYEYFVMLKNLITQAIAEGVSGEPLSRAQNLLITLPNQVLGSGVTTSFLWTDIMVNRTAADIARSEILQALVDLKSLIVNFNVTRIPGDANDDGNVDVGDLGIIAANYGQSGKAWHQGDFNGDGKVDVGDLGILAAHYGVGMSNSSTIDFVADYHKAFGMIADDSKDNAEVIDSPICSGLGLPLVVGLVLMGLMLVKIED
jgi:hypothetical protein